MALLKITDQCRIVDIDTGVIYGSLGKRTDGIVYFRGNLLVETSWSPDMYEQLYKILSEINNT